MAASRSSEQRPALDACSDRVQLAAEFVAKRLGYRHHAYALARLVEESELSGRSLEDVAIDVIVHVSPLDP